MLSALIVLAQMPAMPFMRYPDIHGDLVAYTSEGDLWLGNLKSGESKRLTTDAGVERNAAFSPDGKWIAFEGEYDGSRQAYVIATEGGAPRRLSSVENFRAVTGWTPDGQNVLIRKLQSPTNYEQDLLPVKGGAPVRVPLEFSSHVWFGHSADEYAFTRFNRWSMNWFRYIGGMQNQIWVHRNGKFSQITSVDGTNEFPVWVGDRIYFSNEKDAKFTLMSVAPDGGKARVELPASDTEIRELSTDGQKVIFEKGPDVQIFDPADKAAHPVAFTTTSDLIHMRPTMVDPENGMTSMSLTPTAKRALFETRGQIVSVPVGDGEARVWKATPGVRYRYPMMSKDAKKIAYFSDATGEMELYTANADGSGEKQLTKDANRQLVNMTWSPDGKWILLNDSTMRLYIVNAETGDKKEITRIPGTWTGVKYDVSPDSKWVVYQNLIPITGNGAIELYEIATGKVTRITDGRSDDTAPVFSSDGKYIAYLSKRNISITPDILLNQLNTGGVGLAYLLPCKADAVNPLLPKDTEEGAPAPEKKDEPFRLDVDGLWDRRIEVPAPAGNYTQIAMFGDRILLLLPDARQISYFDLSKKTGGLLLAGTGFNSSWDNSKILVRAQGVPVVIDPMGQDRKELSFGGLKLQIQPQAEWKEMFWDGWRLLRDYFYVPNMHGNDWPAIGKKYGAYVSRIRSRDELDELLRWMQGEIGSSHEYLSPGDGQDIKTRTPGAYLGVDLEATPSGYYRIKKIIKGDGFRPSEQSPLARYPGKVHDGMYLIEVAGTPAKVGEDIYQALAGRAGKTVSIKVNSNPSPDGATTLIVTPVASEQRMRYVDWVESNRKYVEKATNGRIGYLHLAAMSNGDMNDFIKQYFPQRDKEALIVDVRFNNGGYVQDYINRILNESLTGFFNQRDSIESWTRQQDYFLGPMACLINEFNISCGEEFPHRFRDLKRGPLIGRRTMGGEVGSDPGWPLADGGRVSVPNYGMWTPDGNWAIEGKGVSPDIDVPSDPNAYAQGHDPQIDKAIEWLLDDLKKHPRNRGALPPMKDRVKNGGG